MEDSPPAGAEEWESHYAYTLGLQAYIYGFPWMYLAQLRWLWTSEAGRKVAEAQHRSMPWAPLNNFFNVDHLATPEDQTGGSPNHDTLYSVAWLDLAAEPMVISAPAITDRFWCMQMCCIDSDNFTYIGSKATGNAAANYLVGGPGWHGAVPADVLDVLPRARTPAVLIFGRTGVNDDADGGADLQKARALQLQYRITPLSVWAGQPRHPSRPPHAQVPAGIDYENALGSWITMNRAMTENPPGAAPGIDQAELLRLFATIGIGPGQRLEDRSPATRAGLQRAAKHGLRLLRQMAKGRGKSINSWHYPPPIIGRAGQASDFVTRAAMQALAGISAHDPEQAVYVNTAKDSDGNALASDGAYVMAFDPAAGGFPPYQKEFHGFWSVTMYGADYNLVKGTDNYFVNGYYPRFQTLGPDGNMTVLIQREQPPDPLPDGTYWLQTPDPADPTTASWYLILRVYAPGPEVSFIQSWAPPAIRRVS
ncbi:DUF1254 domain-containing protein [Roseomonas aerophila]|uniref:DUF1254 domain-containing protein n=1 Tax=Teichococcus aerophilus TaxID=1224513 RepID=A0ABR7RKT0_9PROT|nr:DUF1254 domain-containing protein [Pseudoroseomonas aerophila]MBC9206725.1 DUF1254 domain-containing protein [Pseudoroseomonas aerophila]